MRSARRSQARPFTFVPTVVNLAGLPLTIARVHAQQLSGEFPVDVRPGAPGGVHRLSRESHRHRARPGHPHPSLVPVRRPPPMPRGTCSRPSASPDAPPAGRKSPGTERRALSGSAPPASTVLRVRAPRGRACGASGPSGPDGEGQAEGQARNERGELLTCIHRVISVNTPRRQPRLTQNLGIGVSPE